MDLPHSDTCFVKAYPAEIGEAFCDGHVAAFAFFGGVARSVLYDNTRLAVARILGMGHAGAPGVQRAAVPLPLRRSLRAARQGQRQGYGRGPDRLEPPELPGAEDRKSGVKGRGGEGRG